MQSDLDALGEIIRTYCRKNEFGKARSICETYLSRATNDEESAVILHRLAYIENAAGDLLGSIQLLRRARKLDPRSRAVLDALMIAFIASKNFTKAVDLCISLIDLDREFIYQSFTSSAYFHLAYSYFQLKKFEQAELALDKCGYKDPIWIDRGLLSKLELLDLIRTKRDLGS
jgi:tetratricopeptide (TPR) repeat protein